jgi:hypothetical protein
MSQDSKIGNIFKAAKKGMHIRGMIHRSTRSFEQHLYTSQLSSAGITAKAVISAV